MTFAMSRAVRGQFLADHVGEAGLVGARGGDQAGGLSSLR